MRVATRRRNARSCVTKSSVVAALDEELLHPLDRRRCRDGSWARRAAARRAGARARARAASGAFVRPTPRRTARRRRGRGATAPCRRASASATRRRRRARGAAGRARAARRRSRPRRRGGSRRGSARADVRPRRARRRRRRRSCPSTSSGTSCSSRVTVTPVWRTTSPAVGRDGAVEQLHDRALPRAVAAEQTDALAALDAKLARSRTGGPPNAMLTSCIARSAMAQPNAWPLSSRLLKKALSFSAPTLSLGARGQARLGARRLCTDIGSQTSDQAFLGAVVRITDPAPRGTEERLD